MSKLLVATKAHAGQVDKGGQPYILHPLRLMLKFDSEIEMIVAVMHDVVEDSDFTQYDLKKLAFQNVSLKQLIVYLREMVRTTITFYYAYQKNALAKKIKVEDIKDNLDMTRLNEITEKDLQRLQKYHQALKILKGT
ncbi:hypothetical protein ACRN9G_03700 [Shewanella frigidimarina]|uniref:hypothetical protein n=1 Tax=Shewanella frigidimarina TaxID=56812 RepID=UPI003D7B4182